MGAYSGTIENSSDRDNESHSQILAAIDPSIDSGTLTDLDIPAYDWL
jgi:hypothetical protein